MAKFVIAAKTDKTDAVADLRRDLPGKPIAEIRIALSTGAPIVDRTLFHNDHDDAAAQLKAVIATLREHDIEPRVYELADDADVELLIDSDKQESVEYLDAVLTRYEQVKVDQRGRG